ncbi:MAG: tRNA (adenosine(37)-N6)-dimethylallyltransferase MiaA, partial [Rhodanobacteraceae bacterium]
PLLVGGTSLYFRALQYGLSPLPPADPDIRCRLAQEAEDSGWPALHARLQKLDPESAARIKPGDSQRIQRALEVIELTGQPLSDQLSGLRPRFEYRVLKLALVPERELLHQRIAERLDIMLEAGFLDEVRALRQRGDLDADMPAMRAVGYRQAWQHLDGDTTAEQFRDAALAATRHLAKRQTTWLRSTLDARWLQTASATDAATWALADFLG